MNAIMGVVASAVAVVGAYLATPVGAAVGAAVGAGGAVYGIKSYSDNRQKEREENAKLTRIEIERKKR